jgi:hypothetical protein
MTLGRLDKIVFLQDQREDKAFIIPNSYKKNGEFQPRKVIEISSEYPTIIGVFGSERYSSFSSKVTRRVGPKKGVLSKLQLAYLNTRNSVFGGLSIGQDNITTMIYPTMDVDQIELGDLLLVRAQRYMPFFGERSPGEMSDTTQVIFGKECNYDFIRGEVLEKPHIPGGYHTAEEHIKLGELYKKRVEQVGEQLEESLVSWLNGNERLTPDLFVKF